MASLRNNELIFKSWSVGGIQLPASLFLTVSIYVNFAAPRGPPFLGGEGPEPIGRKMKKHTHAEILSKLERADELARAGKSRVEICKALGVSVMTLHRWQKLPLPKREAIISRDRAADSKGPANTLSGDEMLRLLEELTPE